MRARIRLRREPSGGRYQISAVASERTGNTVRERHVIGLGAIRVRSTPLERLKFWDALMQRLAGLGENWMTEADKFRIVSGIERTIARPTAAELPEIQAALHAEGERLAATLVMKPAFRPVIQYEAVLLHNGPAAAARAQIAIIDQWVATLPGLRGGGERPPD